LRFFQKSLPHFLGMNLGNGILVSQRPHAQNTVSFCPLNAFYPLNDF
jgi:hypothetical protein